MKTLLLFCLIIALSVGCASTSGLTIAEDMQPLSNYAGDATLFPDYSPNYPDYCQNYPDDCNRYYPDYLWYLDYYPYPYYYPCYPYYGYLYRFDDGNDDNYLFSRGYWKQINKRIEYRSEMWRKARETRISRINHARERQRELRIKRINNMRSGFERMRPRNIFRGYPGRGWRR